MKRAKLPPIVVPLIVPLIVTVLLCAGLWLYTAWDLKKFEESLPKVPSVQSAKSETAPSQQGGQSAENSKRQDPSKRYPRCPTPILKHQPPSQQHNLLTMLL